MSRSLRVLLTWRPDSAGDEAAQYVAWLARTQPIVVQTVSVVPKLWSTSSDQPVDEAYEQWLQQEGDVCSKNARKALKDAGIPKDMFDDTPSVVISDHSETNALIRAAKEFKADMMILGSRDTASKGHFSPGSTADALLHCSPLPLGLAPRNNNLSKQGVTRVNCSYVDTDQSQEALRHAADLAHRWDVPLRLVTFMPRDVTMYPTEVPFPANADHTEQLQKQALGILERGTQRALNRYEDLEVTYAAGVGDGWAGAMQDLEWKKGDMLALGSSMLGEFGKVFIGPSTNQIVRNSPVPVFITPV